MKIVILDGYTANPGDLSWDGLREIGELTVFDRTKPEETIERAKDADILLTNKVLLRRGEIEKLPSLKYIGVLATGYNVVDLAAAKERGIVVTNVPAYSTESVAQMVFAHLLTITNRTEHYAILNRGDKEEKKWSKSPDFCYWDTKLTELAGKTFGIIGYGNIGRRVGEIAKAFGMKVQALKSMRNCQPDDSVTRVSLDELLRTSDMITLHCPLTDSTRHIINKETLMKMKPAAVVINTGRGPLVDDNAVAEALANGTIAVYCADVLTEEPPNADNPLLSQPNAYITPHIAWATTEARTRLIQVAVDNVRAFVSGSPQNVVSC